MKTIVYIFLGGGIGSVLRYLISQNTQKIWTYNHFPVGTFVVNIIGCFLIGFLSTYFLKTDHYLRFLLIVGFCGGFTTFSTFSAENYQLWQNGNYITLFLYIFLSIMIGFFATYFGLEIAKK